MDAETGQRYVAVGTRSLVCLVILCYDRILCESVLDPTELREIAYEFLSSFNRSFSCKLRIRGSDPTTWGLVVTHTLQKRDK